MNCGILGNGTWDTSPINSIIAIECGEGLDWGFQRGIMKTGSDALSLLHKEFLVKNAPAQMELQLGPKFPRPTWYPASL